ncbi:MAG: GAF domain-containing protein [Alphaproteobacteria bacterium]|uniref:GAF domain-containing protein n=1 Tax=Candidatus Nitrobium versatile TaxID=2884831 RepID=A0A953M1L3_9BACT|nr:GAF domain-containing protein [Candidatus Nitrobium versatile]
MKHSAIQLDNFFDILNTILSTLDINEILTSVVEQIRSVIKADRCTLYLIDRDNGELYSKVLQADNLVEIRVPLTNTSLAGYSAFTAQPLIIGDAYNDTELAAIDGELRFDRRWDEKSGYRTRSVLVVPIPFRTDQRILGVFQALNKEGGFTEADLGTMEQLAFLLGIAVNNALLYQSIEEEKKLREYIIDDIEEGICILDRKKRIVSANRFLEVMSGMRYTVDSMAGEDFFALFPTFVGTPVEEKLNDVLVNGYGFKQIAQLELLEVKIIPYFDEKSAVKRVILIFTRF